ncbi:MAG: hypothetical protein HYR55_08880 [Acidobacteria bacterium]|nr:hypothetical protein [Acidobacteriota bacterium]MBI3655790.1 hypothetical protein [Acidobacteriota bacterium]
MVAWRSVLTIIITIVVGSQVLAREPSYPNLPGTPLVRLHPMWADDPAGCESRIDQMEQYWFSGATNINGISGNGGLSAGFSAQGELTVLRWPSPSYYDQVNYKTSHACDARQQPRLGARENMGSFAGLFFMTRDGARAVSWLRDADWRHEQLYHRDDSNVLVTISTHPILRLQVTTSNWVFPSLDLLAWHFEIEKLPDSPIVEANLVYFENLAPSLAKIPYIPLADWLLDDLNDYAVLYDSRRDAMLHFRPRAMDLRKLTPLLTGEHQELQQEVNQFIDRLRSSLGEGVYIAIGGDFESAEHQAGYDERSEWPRLLGWTHTAEDAFRNAADGRLSNSPMAGSRSNSAMTARLTFNEQGKADVTVYLAVSDFPDGEQGAFALLDYARSRAWSDHRLSSESWWSQWLRRARLPNTDDQEVLALAKRSLIVMKTAQDARTGAIVASISTQPPYAEDWPRDGAFINYALDAAGYTEMVTFHNQFYVRAQRRGGFLPGTFEMNYYADGVPGGPIFFEIDNTGLALWSLWEHYNFLSDAVEKENYLASIYPTLKRGADALASCRDPLTRLQCYAFEDDIPRLQQNLQGALTVHLALRSALAAGAVIGEDEAVLQKWQDRLEELQAAILLRLYDRQAGHFRRDQGTGPLAWMIWPVKLLDYEDARVDVEAEWMFEQISQDLRGLTAGGAYVGKVTLALARLWAGKPEKMSRLQGLVDILLREVPTFGTYHYGEVFKTMAAVDGRPLFDNRVGIPHVWEHALSYLTSLALYGRAE